MLQPQWKTALDALVVDNPKIMVAFALVERLYNYQLIKIIANNYPESITKLRYLDTLSSRELHIYFLQEVYGRYVNYEQLLEYVEYYEKNPHGDYGKTERCPVSDLRLGDVIYQWGRAWTVIEFYDDYVYVDDNLGHKDTIFNTIKWVYRFC